MTSHLKPVTWRIDQRLLEGLEEVRRRDGISVSEQVRRAIVVWLDMKKSRRVEVRGEIPLGVLSLASTVRMKRARKKPERRREQARKRS